MFKIMHASILMLLPTLDVHVYTTVLLRYVFRYVDYDTFDRSCNTIKNNVHQNDNNIITDLDNAITSFVVRLCCISNRTLEYGYMLLVKVNDKETSNSDKCSTV